MSARSSLAGACGALSLVSAGTGIVAWIYPTESVLGPIARTLDALSPWLLTLGLVFACLTVALRLRVAGAGLCLLSLAAGAAVGTSYLHVTEPPDTEAQPELRVLFFNVLSTNEKSGSRIVAAAVESGADIAVFAEATALRPSLDMLRASYDFVSPCTEASCELLVATNLDVVRFWKLQLNPVWPERYAVLEFARPSGGTAFLAASHLAKPWMTGVSEPEIARLIAQYNWLSGPSLIVGDFNMPPWSLPMRRILESTGFRAIRGQPATWPVSAGPFRFPVDQLLVREGVGTARVEAFGMSLGSNHLGILADIVIAPDP